MIPWKDSVLTISSLHMLLYKTCSQSTRFANFEKPESQLWPPLGSASRKGYILNILAE